MSRYNRRPFNFSDVTGADGTGSGLDADFLDGKSSEEFAQLVAGKIDTANLPALAISETFVVNSQAAMLALSAERGDVCVRTDQNKTYILAADAPGTLGNWKELLASGMVVSVNGQNGTVTLGASDVGADPAGTAAGLVDDLSGVTNQSTARTNLGLGDAATKNVGTAAGTVAAGDDARLSNARTPSAHASTHVTGGSDALTSRFTFSNADYTIVTTTQTTVVTQTGTLSAARTVTLPAASAVPAGARVVIQAGAGVSTTNTFSIARAGSDTINGATSSLVINGAYAWRELTSDGVSNWTQDATVLRTNWTGVVNALDNHLQRPVFRDYSELCTYNATATGTVDIDYAASNVHDLTLTGNVTTLTFSNPPPAGTAGSLTLVIRQDATARTIAWPNSVQWSGGSAPDLSTVSKVYVVSFITTNNGTRWYGVLGMTGMTA